MDKLTPAEALREVAAEMEHGAEYNVNVTLERLTCVVCGKPVTIRPDARLCVKHLPPVEITNPPQGE